jgi:low affinity Fe/Cu permease
VKAFDRLVNATVRWSGSATAVIGSFVLVVVWACLGPYYDWSEAHQLWINTSTTIITFWLCFLILAAQNRDTLALHAKLDELIRVTDARNELIGVERRPEQEITNLRPRDGLSA